jgi:hypothetical protein
LKVHLTRLTWASTSFLTEHPIWVTQHAVDGPPFTLVIVGLLAGAACCYYSALGDGIRPYIAGLGTDSNSNFQVSAECVWLGTIVKWKNQKLNHSKSHLCLQHTCAEYRMRVSNSPDPYLPQFPETQVLWPSGTGLQLMNK